MRRRGGKIVFRGSRGFNSMVRRVATIGSYIPYPSITECWGRGRRVYDIGHSNRTVDEVLMEGLGGVKDVGVEIKEGRGGREV